MGIVARNRCEERVAKIKGGLPIKTVNTFCGRRKY